MYEPADAVKLYAGRSTMISKAENPQASPGQLQVTNDLSSAARDGTP